MQVTIDFMGPVLRPPGVATNPHTATVAPTTTVQALLLGLGYQPAHVRHLAVFREGDRLPPTTELRDGDVVTLSVPFGGG